MSFVGEIKIHRHNAVHVIDGLTDVIEQRQMILQRYLLNKGIVDYKEAITHINSNETSSMHR